MQVLILIGIAFTVTANAIWNNPDPCPYVWGTNNHEIIRNECKLVLKYGNTLKWVKKETYETNSTLKSN